MANEEHLARFLGNIEEWNKWREENPDVEPDLSGAAISGKDFYSHSQNEKAIGVRKKINLRGTNLKGCRFNNVNFCELEFDAEQIVGIAFNNCNLINVTFLSSKGDEHGELVYAQFSGSALIGVKFINLTLIGCNLRRVKAANNVQFERCVINKECDFSSVQLVKSEFRDCQFEDPELGGMTVLESEFVHVSFAGCHLDHVSILKSKMQDVGFNKACFVEVDLTGSTLYKASFFDARFQQCNVDYTVFRSVKGLHGTSKANVTGSENEESCKFLSRKIFPTWKNARFINSLPLFGVSYSALIFIPLFFSVLEVYNTQIQDLSERLPIEIQYNEQEYVLGEGLRSTINALQIEPSNHLLFTLFAATAMAVGSTLFAFCCPSIVKDYTEEKWKIEMGKSLLEYRSLSITKPYACFISLYAYVSGGAFLVLDVAYRVLNALFYGISGSAC